MLQLHAAAPHRVVSSSRQRSSTRCFAAVLWCLLACRLNAAPETSVTVKPPALKTPQSLSKHDTNRATRNQARRAPVPWRVPAALQAGVLLVALGIVFACERIQRKGERQSPLRFARVWRVALAATRAALLAVSLMPAALQWRVLVPQLSEFSGAFSLSLGAALAALGLSYWRTRGSNFMALFLCSGAAVATIFMMLALRLSGSSPALRALSLGAPEAGYFIGAALVCGGAWAASGVFFGRTLFAVPLLEHRAVNPLEAPYAPATRAQLRLVSLCVVAALALALTVDRKSGAALAAVATLSFATALFVWGWRSKQLRARQILVALCCALPATVVLALLTGLLALPSLGALRAAPAAVFALMPAVRGRINPALPLGIALCAALFLLQRPPAHLWTLLAQTPLWGWLLIGSLGAACTATLVFAAGASLALGLCSVVVPAFVFVWLERAERVG